MTLTVKIGSDTKVYYDMDQARINRLITLISETFDGWDLIDNVPVTISVK